MGAVPCGSCKASATAPIASSASARSAIENVPLPQNALPKASHSEGQLLAQHRASGYVDDGVERVREWKQRDELKGRLARCPLSQARKQQNKLDVEIERVGQAAAATSGSEQRCKVPCVLGKGAVDPLLVTRLPSENHIFEKLPRRSYEVAQHRLYSPHVEEESLVKISTRQFHVAFLTPLRLLVLPSLAGQV